MIEYTLPWPPSANNLFVGRHRRHVSRAYKCWRHHAGLSMRVQRVPAITKPAAIEIILTPPDRRRRDCDNLAKPIVDLAVSMGVLIDDSRRYVKSIAIRWADEVGEAGALVRIREA